MVVNRNLRVDVVIPVYNEERILEQKIGGLLSWMKEHPGRRWRVVIVDNGSTDKTNAIASEIAAREEDVVSHSMKVRGRGYALKYVWSNSDADVVCYMDADMSTDLKDLPTLVDAVAVGGYDLAVGSRVMSCSSCRRSILRGVLSRGYNLILKIFLGVGFGDAQCGFKAAGGGVVKKLLPEVMDGGWFFDTELLVLAEKKGFSVVEVPVSWAENPESKVELFSTVVDYLKKTFVLRGRLKNI